VAHLQWSTKPKLKQPIVLAAFQGWNDAGDAATTAIDLLLDQWGALKFAEIDPEEFFDFTATRPTVRLGPNHDRLIQWPTSTLSWARPPGAPDIVILRGSEPQLKWRTFCEQVIEVSSLLHARLVLTVGSLLADVAHSRPTPVYGTAYDEQVIKALHLEPSRYEGPTGIIGVLHAALHAAGLNSASLWAAVPSYVPSAPSPKAALALLERLSGILQVEVDTQELTDAVPEYERQIGALVSEDEETTAYVAHLESIHDQTELAGDAAPGLVAELERYLREH
jgi:proteasome assembly chaperone (PAC2) family protein